MRGTAERTRALDQHNTGVMPSLSERPREDGFAAVDAMVALAILATAVILSLQAAQTAGRLVSASAEMHRADGQLRYLIDTAPRSIGLVSGLGSEFGWQVLTQPAAGTRIGGAQICERTATLHGVRTGRVYSLATEEVCPAS